ncbi:hypothetical protein ACRU43_20580 [Mycobacterium colombiense]
MLKDVFEWCNLYLALPLGLAAFGIAIWQIRDAKSAANEAKTAADAAKHAADKAIANFKARSVSSLIPQLMQLEDMIAQAVNKQSTEFMTHALHTWSWQAAMCRELLDETQTAEQKIMQNIQRSTSAATTLKKQLLTVDDTFDWPAKTSRMRGAVSDVNSGLQALSAALVVKEPK